MKFHIRLLLITTVIFISSFELFSMTSKDTSDFKFKLYSDGVDFYATGNEPFWNLSIAVNQFFRFNSLNGITVKLGSVQSEKAMDANVVRYTAGTPEGLLTATISQNECIDNMSGDTSSYRVVVEFNNLRDENYMKFEGCGNYIPNYGLNRKWILKKLGDSDISISDVNYVVPELDINLEEMRFAGSGGCNSIAGGIFLEYNLIRFLNPLSTMMMCENMQLEQKFLDAISKVTYFKLLGNRLLLANPDTLLMVLYAPETLPGERATDGDDSARVYRLNDIWVLEILNGKTVEIKNSKSKIPQLEINIEEMGFGGNGGCNSISGNFKVDGKSISFGPVAATRMMCPDSTEPEFLSALKEVNTWDIRGNRLYLMKDDVETAVFMKVD